MRVERVRATLHRAAPSPRSGVLLSIASIVATCATSVLAFVAMSAQLEGPGVLGLLAAFFVLPTAAHLYLAFRGRPRAREVELLCGPGEVRTADGSFVLRARDVVGASTAPHQGRVLLHVEDRTSPGPHTLLFEDLASLDEARRSLGLLHGGTGAVEWPVRRSVSRVFGIIGAVSALACGGLNVLMLFAWPFLAAWPKKMASGERVGIGATGVTHGGVTYPYTWVDGATFVATPRAITLWRAGLPYASIPCPNLEPEECERVVSQINAASRRARGEVVHRESALDRLTQIQRAPGEPARAWLGRLEALVASVGADNYRAAPIGVDDLWRIAEDADEGTAARVGAARLLLRARGPEVGPRIATALANVREPEAKVRIAVEAPIDQAEAVIDAFEADEPQALRMARRV